MVKEIASARPGLVGIASLRGSGTLSSGQARAVQQGESVVGSAKAAQQGSRVQELTVVGGSAGAQEPKPQELAANVEKLNSLAQVMQRELRFSVHKETERVVIEVIDKDTDEVIRTIPPQEALALIEHFQDSTLMVSEEA